METKQILELTVALVLALTVFVMASGARATLAIGFVLILMPFQAIETKYGSSNVVFTYVLAAALLMNGKLRLPMLGSLGLILVAYMASLSQSDRSMYLPHAIYIFQFVSGMAMFILAYNFARDVEHPRAIINVLIAMNVLVVGYCFLQLWAGPGHAFVPFGIEALETNRSRGWGDARLIGPFNNPGVTAEYFVLMTLLLAFDLLHSTGNRRRWLVLLLGINLMLLVATGNRGGFLVLVAVYPLFLYGFRRELGSKRIVQFSIGGVIVLALASVVAITFTDFGRLFERLGGVADLKGGIPATRSEPWPIAVEKIRQQPWFGEGPLFRDTDRSVQENSLVEQNPYPHDLYLFLLRTVGLFGLLALLTFFVRIWIRVHKAGTLADVDTYRAGLLRVGSLLILVFFLDQIKIEFARRETIDFVHFVFALFGLLLGVADRPRVSDVAITPARPGGQAAAQGSKVFPCGRKSGSHLLTDSGRR